MLFPQKTWAGLTDGTVTVAFRRWRRATVKTGGTLQSPGGLLSIDAVEIIDPSEVSDEDAVAAGHLDRNDVLAQLRPEGALYRVRFHRVGDDPRIVLRRQADLADTEFDELTRVLQRLGWATPTLALIAANPGVVSTDLAARVGVERLHFKQRVRRLKTLGLTESLKIGYRISPRGAAILARLDP